MRFSITLRLLAAVCILAGLIFIMEKEKPVKVKNSMFDFKAADITDIRIERGDFHVYCFRKGESWFIAEPIQVRADDNKVDGIAGVLEMLEKQEIVTRAERESRKLTLKDYGLHKPRVSLVVGAKRGGETFKEELWIGQDAPLGDSLYVKIGTNDEVVSTARAIMSVIPEKLESLRDRTILHGDASKTSRIEIKRLNSGFIQLTRAAGNEWFIQQPIVARADGVRVRQMLESLYSMQVVDFVWDANVETGDVVHAAEPAVNPNSKVEVCRLTADQAVVGVTVWVNGDDIGRELFFGKESGEKSDKVYARCKDIDSVYTVPKGNLDAVNTGINDLRDRNLFFLGSDKVNYVLLEKGDRKLALVRQKNSGWIIAEPVQWKADDRFVNELVDHITRLRVDAFPDATNAASVDLRTPAVIIKVSSKIPEAGGAVTNRTGKPAGPGFEPPGALVLKQSRLFLGGPRDGKETVFARFEEEPYVLEISGKALDFIGKDPVDPLIYRDRTMLSLDPAAVRRISLVKGGVEHAVERSEVGNWIPVGGGTNQVDTKAVDDLLFATAHMRAIRTECQNPDNLIQYGLDRSGTVVTFGLTGEKGIQKTIILGYRARTDGIYALVQGLDVVFVISNAMMDLLARDLIKPMVATP